MYINISICGGVISIRHSREGGNPDGFELDSRLRRDKPKDIFEIAFKKSRHICLFWPGCHDFPDDFLIDGLDTPFRCAQQAFQHIAVDIDVAHDLFQVVRTGL